MRSFERSFKHITQNDLRRLADIAKEDRMDLFNRKPELGKLYKNRVICVTLCQGAALHYVDGKNGIKDFDVWTFYREHPQQPFPYRRNMARDFGDPKFGKTPGKTDFKGRCVDLIGRSIPWERGQTLIQTLINYLKYSKNLTPRLLSGKAVIILEPYDLIGTVVWPI